MALLDSTTLIDSQTNVKTLPGYPGPLPFKLETGYIGVGEDEAVQLFYYFVESEGNPEKDPLIIWLSGGPGCSTLHGFFFEIGPLQIDYGRYLDDVPALQLHPYSWTKVASIIYLDAPATTGYSYTENSKAAHSSDTLSGSQTAEFIRKVASIIYLDAPATTGYSYTENSKAAHSSDTLSGSQTAEFIRKKVSFDNLDLGTGVENTYSMANVTVRKHKKSQRNATVNDTSNAAGVANISSDPSIATDDQTKSIKSKHDYINVLFGVSLKTMKDIDDFTKGCEDGTYSVWNELESDVRTMVMEAICGLAEAFSAETIAKSTTTKPTHESPIVQVDSGYIAVNPLTDKAGDVNARLEYAYRMALISKDLFESTKKDCNGEYADANPNNLLCMLDIKEIDIRVKGINMQHILEPNCNKTSSLFKTINPMNRGSSRSLKAGPIKMVPAKSLRKDTFCRDDTYNYATLWANNNNVMKALNIRKGTVDEFLICIEDMKYKYGRSSYSLYEYNVLSSVVYHDKLLKRNCRALILSGDHDMKVSHVGTYNWINALNLTIKTVNGTHGTPMVKKLDYLLKRSNEGAGHTAPEYKPEECFEIVKRWFAHKALSWLRML
ncbi:Peptidase S10, serine carboxypeptidase [Artemisia annua]|uniref:Peptidase S10, serine carboxypeptidase n=1 Tax=Artemisia annua TaxID=35608 RepID=A0A2U1MFW8_ARTAN|nr:Peptidase S10, serine carboxypeptidase [Artemisia annua]